MSDLPVLGLDSCAAGWVGICWSGSRVYGVFGTHVAAAVEEATNRLGVPVCIGIDIPIGLPDAGSRQADLLARESLGTRRSTLFITPTRAALCEPDFHAAVATNRRLAGVGISQQAFALRHKIFDVERYLPDAPCPVVEVHPEMSFARLHGDPVLSPKKTWAGMRARMRLLDDAGLHLPGDLGPAGRRAATDDVLDAAVVAWTARRVASGEAGCLPDPPEVFSDSRPAAIWV